MSIGLASMNPMPGPQLGVVMVHDKPMDKDLTQGYSNYNVMRDFQSDEMLSLDKNGKVISRKSKELDEHAVAVYVVNEIQADAVYEALLQESKIDYVDRPIHEQTFIYEVFTGHRLLCEDQADYDPLLERVYLDKLTKKVIGIVDGFDSEARSIMVKGKTDGHYPLEERPEGATEEDSSVKFPMLAHATVFDGISLEKAESIFESILTGKGEEVVETDEP